MAVYGQRVRLELHTAVLAFDSFAGVFCNVYIFGMFLMVPVVIGGGVILSGSHVSATGGFAGASAQMTVGY